MIYLKENKYNREEQSSDLNMYVKIGKGKQKIALNGQRNYEARKTS